MFYNKRIEALEEEAELRRKANIRFLKNLGLPIEDNGDYYPRNLPNLILLEKKLIALEQHLGIEYKVEETKTEGYVKKEEGFIGKVFGIDIVETTTPTKRTYKKKSKKGRKKGATKANGYKV